MRLSLVLMLLTAANALAVAKGGTLYIKSPDTRVLKQPSEKSAAVMTLQPGTEVVWLGASAKDKQWHEVNVNGKKGFVQRSDLTPFRAQEELDSSNGRPLSATAFAASGFLKCSYSPGTVQSFKGNAASEQAAA